MPKYINVADMIQDIVIKTIKEKGFVQVIRCKECKWNGGDCCFCTNPNLAIGGDYASCLYIEPDWFCANGERKE